MAAVSHDLAGFVSPTAARLTNAVMDGFAIVVDTMGDWLATGSTAACLVGLLGVAVRSRFDVLEAMEFAR